jgi:DNA-binding response OmpR family regulator
MRIAIVEHDPVERSRFGALFARDGASPALFSTGQQFLNSVSQSDFDFAMIDMRLPDMSGLQVLDQLQSQERLALRHLPTMIVSASPNATLMQAAFEHGADDFLQMPCRNDELLIRTKTIVRRAHPRLFDDAPILVGNIRLNLATLQAEVGQRAVPLSQKEFRLAWLLFMKRGQTINRAEILRLVWGRHDYQSSRTLDTHIGRLRQKLQLDHQAHIRLHSVYGVGYRLDVFS